MQHNHVHSNIDSCVDFIVERCSAARHPCFEGCLCHGSEFQRLISSRRINVALYLKVRDEMLATKKPAVVFVTRGKCNGCKQLKASINAAAATDPQAFNELTSNFVMVHAPDGNGWSARVPLASVWTLSLWPQPFGISVSCSCYVSLFNDMNRIRVRGYGYSYGYS